VKLKVHESHFAISVSPTDKNSYERLCGCSSIANGFRIVLLLSEKEGIDL